MTKATAAITDQFKNTFVKTRGVDTTEIQRALFQMGFYFSEASPSTKRHVFRPEELTYLRVDNCGAIWRSAYMDNPAGVVANCREVVPSKILEAAEEVRNIKREEGKASKKRRAKRKWDATAIKHYGQTRPVRHDAVVAAKLRGGQIITRPAEWFDWSIEGTYCDVVSYKVLEQRKGKPMPVQSSTATVDEMFADIAESLGKEVGVIEHVATVGDVNSDARGSGARFNAGKPDFSLIPMSLLEGEARVWAYGAKKYKAWNWMKGMDWNVPFACAMRHMAAWQRGEDIDPETGESHLDHAMCNLRMLRYYTDYYKEGDNRPKEFFNVQAGA